jgi:hypothetical protein
MAVTIKLLKSFLPPITNSALCFSVIKYEKNEAYFFMLSIKRNQNESFILGKYLRYLSLARAISKEICWLINKKLGKFIKPVIG